MMRWKHPLFGILCLAALGLPAERLSALPTAGFFNCTLDEDMRSFEASRSHGRTVLPDAGQARLRLEYGSMSVLELNGSIPLPAGGALELSRDPGFPANGLLTPLFSGVTIPLHMLLRTPGGREESMFLDAQILGTLEEHTTWSIGGFLPGDLAPFGGRRFFLPMACTLAPVAEAVPDTGMTSFGTYVGATSGGQSALGDVMTGNFILDPVDLDIPGRGLSLSLERTYNAQAALDGSAGVFGRGWSSLLDVRVEPDGDTYLFHDASGADYLFEYSYRFPLGSSTYTALGLHAVLFGSVTVAYEDGTKLKFGFATPSPGTKYLLTAIEDRHGNRISIERDADGRPQRIVDSLGRKVEVKLDTAGRVTGIEPPSPLGSISYEYESDGLLHRVTRGSKETSYSYDSFFLMVATTDPRGFMARFDYEDSRACLGHIKTIRYAREAGATPATFDTYSFSTCSRNIATVRDPNGHTTVYTWDETVDPAPTRIIDPLGRETRYRYDYPFFDLALQKNDEQTLEWEHDSFDGRLLSFKQTFREGAAPLVTKLTYSGNPSDCKPNRDLPCFLDSLLVRSVTDPEGHTTSFEYEEGQVSEITDALGHTTSFTYAAPGATLHTVTRPRGTSTVDQTYDGSGNLVEVVATDPLGRKTTTRFDAVGRRSELIAADGSTTSYEHDGLSRLTAVTFGDGTVAFTYDDSDNLLTQTDSTGTTVYTYDHRDRRVRDTLPNGATVDYAYDGVGNLLRKADAGGTVEYGYDAGDRLATLTQPDGSKVLYSDFDGNDNPERVSYPNGMTLTRHWDGAGRLKQLKATTALPAGFGLPDTEILLVAAGYEYNSTRLHQSTNTQGDVTEYSYDVLGQLVGAITRLKRGPTGYRAWSYDANGNRESQVLGPPARRTVTEYSYDDGDQLLKAAAPCPLFEACDDPLQFPRVFYTWNDTGDLLRSGGLEFEYDAAQRTTAITPPSGAADKLSFTYSGLDQMARTGVRKGDGEETAFTYDLTGIGPASEEPGAPGLEPAYYTRTPDGELVSLRRGAQTFYYVTDRLGSVLALVAFRPAVVNRYEYDPWGKVLSEIELPDARQPFRFAAAELDVPTGLYKMGARYYDPALGRFTQPDPLGSLLSYPYAGNDPVNFVDPEGLDLKDVPAQVVAAACQVTTDLLKAGGGTATISINGAGPLNGSIKIEVHVDKKPAPPKSQPKSSGKKTAPKKDETTEAVPGGC